MQYFEWNLQQQFNTIYTNIENCVLTNPPYLSWRVPETFFLNKRGWFALQTTLWYDKIYDTISYLWTEYYIWTIWTNVVVKTWWNTPTTISTTSIWTTARDYKFIMWTSVKWVPLISWTWLTSNIVDPLNMFLEDLTATWTVNAYAWMYVYITWGTAWIWSVVKIVSNTATRLSIQSLTWTITAWTYSIYPDLSSIPFFLWWDWLYWIHDNTSIVKASNFSNIVDIVFAHERFFWIDINWNISKWGKWQDLLYQTIDSLVSTIDWVLWMTQFQDYLLVMSSNKINVIKKELVTINNNSTEVFTSVEVTKDFWIFSKWSFVIYNEWLYLFNSDRKFISMSIRSLTSTRFSIFIQDEWIYMQKEFDNIWNWSEIKIHIDSNEIKLFNNVWTWTNIFIYDRYYKWWHIWRTDLNIHWYYNVTKMYYWTDTYIINNTNTDDEWWLTITQKIKLVFWQADFRTIKSVKIQKITFWFQTSDWVLVNYKLTSWENLIIFNKQLKWSKLLNQWKIVNSNKWWQLWQSILWLWLILMLLWL